MVSLIKDLFRESPFEPLRFHMKTVMECVSLVRPMFEALRHGQYDELQTIAKKIYKVEHEADIIKDDIRSTIPKRFFLPDFVNLLGDYSMKSKDEADNKAISLGRTTETSS